MPEQRCGGPLHPVGGELCLVVAATFFIGLIAVGAALGRGILSLMIGFLRFLGAFARTTAALAWAVLRGIFGSHG